MTQELLLFLLKANAQLRCLVDCALCIGGGRKNGEKERKKEQGVRNKEQGVRNKEQGVRNKEQGVKEGTGPKGHKTMIEAIKVAEIKL